MRNKREEENNLLDFNTEVEITTIYPVMSLALDDSVGDPDLGIVDIF